MYVGVLGLALVIGIKTFVLGFCTFVTKSRTFALVGWGVRPNDVKIDRVQLREGNTRESKRDQRVEGVERVVASTAGVPLV